MPKPVKKDQTRVAFRDGEVVATSLWCRVAAKDGGVTVTLQHDYGADFRPAAGWALDIGDRQYVVASVDGLVIEGSSV